MARRPLMSNDATGMPWVAKNVRFRQCPDRTACWIWTGSTDGGRPRAYIDGIETTGRVAVYRIIRGKEPPGPLKALCQQPLCVNPNHMNEATA